MAYQVTLIPGDGIGPEVARAARQIIDATGVKIEWHVHDAGGDHVHRYGTALPPETIDAIVKDGVALKGPIATPVGTGFQSVNVQIRKILDLYANFRPARSLPGVPSRYKNVDVIVIRENTEGLYSGLEHMVVPGVVESQRIITKKGSERIMRFAFETARKYSRRKVTAVHKANILKLSDGLFLEVARHIAGEYPDIRYDESIVDATAMKLVLNHTQFDVLVMENLFGDIISDLTSGLIGGLGMSPSANIGENHAVFEAVHGTAPDIAGKGLANPSALTLSGALLLRHLGEDAAAAKIELAIQQTLSEGKTVTRDLGGSASTQEYTDAVIERIRRS